MPTPLSLRHTLLYLLLIVLMAGCTAIYKSNNTKKETPPPNRAWPQQPEKARIVYINSFSTAAEMGITRGFFGNVIDFFTGGDNRHLVQPMAVVSTENGMLYVADPGVHGIHRFDSEKGKYTLIQKSTESDLQSPVGMAKGRDGEIFISDPYTKEVYILKPGSDIAEPLPLTPAPKQPTGLAIDHKTGRLYVVDTARHHIMVFEKDGHLVKTIGRRGNGNGEFNFPTMVWITSAGQLFVTDSLNFQIQVFDTDGNYVRRFGHHGDGTGDMSRPKGIALDQYGHIYVVDALFHSVQLFNSSGDFLLNVGEQGDKAGEFWLPTGIFVNKDNIIYVADSHNHRVQIFKYIGDQP